MTTTFLLVRHAAHDRVGTVLCGRMPGVGLGPVGHAQADRLAERLGNANIVSVRTSPLERAWETAEPIAARAGLPLELLDDIIEIDFGDWSGKSFDALADDPRWTSWNSARSLSRPPNGETMLEAQARVIGAMEKLRSIHHDEAVVLVSHGDVIKAALLYYFGLPIDAYQRFDIDPASISTVVVGDWGSKILCLNQGGAT